MFLPPYQAPNNPLMAEIASRNFVNPVATFPLQESQNFISNLPLISQEAVFVVDEKPGFCMGFPATKKRGRDDFQSVLDNEISIKVQRYCQEIDEFVALHTEKIRAELEAKRTMYLWQVVGAVELGMQRILKRKQEEIEILNKKNNALEERMRALQVEGQLWRNLAQAHEATAIALRRDLEQVLFSSTTITKAKDPKPELLEEGQGDSGDRCDLLSAIGNPDDEELETGCEKGNQQPQRSCRVCGEKELSVLVLPCRHLCLCTDCDCESETCPVCLTPKTTTIQVFMS